MRSYGVHLREISQKKLRISILYISLKRVHLRLQQCLISQGPVSLQIMLREVSTMYGKLCHFFSMQIELEFKSIGQWMVLSFSKNFVLFHCSLGFVNLLNQLDGSGKKINLIWCTDCQSSWSCLASFMSCCQYIRGGGTNTLLISLSRNFFVLPKYLLNYLNHFHIWQGSLQLSCSDSCQIWMWYLIG